MLEPKISSHVYEFYISGQIDSPDNYIEWFDTIRHAKENDTVKLYINSYGGDMFTGIQFMRVLAETQALVICSVEGACMSAATMIFLCADQFEVTPHSMFMFHNYSGGTFGKGGEMYGQIQHERRWSETLLNEIYEGFLTAEEIKSLLDNKDMWMDVDEVILRMEQRVKLMEAKAKAEDLEDEVE
jgi:ATP-dependent protease ClpP protease subunit